MKTGDIRLVSKKSLFLDHEEDQLRQTMGQEMFHRLKLPSGKKVQKSRTPLHK